MAAMTAAVEKRHRSMLIWCGVALSIKAQAIFVAPFFLGLLLARRVAPLSWLWMPAAMMAMYLPAWALGWPLSDLLTVYLRQAEFFERLALNSPNIWAIVQLAPGFDGHLLSQLGKIAAVAAGLGLAGVVMVRQLNGTALLAAGTLSVLLVAGLLPHMHERYFYLADVLAFGFAVACGTRSAWISAALVLSGTALAIGAYITQATWLAAVGALPMLVATARFARVVLAAECGGKAEKLSTRGNPEPATS